MRKIILYLIFIFLPLNYGCRTILMSLGDEKKNTESYRNKNDLSEIKSFQVQNYRGSIFYNQKKQPIRGYCRGVKDSAILITIIMPGGIELGRAKFTEEKIYILNRVDKEVYELSRESQSCLENLPVVFSLVWDAFTGEWMKGSRIWKDIPAGNGAGNINISKENIDESGLRIRVDLETTKKDTLVRSASISDNKNEEILRIHYRDYRRGKVVLSKLKGKIMWRNEFYEINTEFNDWTFNRKLNINFRYGENYNIITEPGMMLD